MARAHQAKGGYTHIHTAIDAYSRLAYSEFAGTENTDNCLAVASCGNTTGSFTCTCPSGTTGDGVSSCTTNADVDECDDGTATCDGNATCTNTVGSYLCTCLAGFVGDGQSCADVDECVANTDNCDPVAGTCTNSTGGSIGSSVTVIRRSCSKSGARSIAKIPPSRIESFLSGNARDHARPS